MIEGEGRDEQEERRGEDIQSVSATSVRAFSQFDTDPNFDLVPHRTRFRNTSVHRDG